MDEKLIEAVESHRMLYDKSDRDFKDRVKKEKIWNHIGELLNTDGASVQRRWKVLRDRYSKERREIACSASGASGDCKVTWEFYAAMAFLDTHVKGRNTSSNVRVSQSHSVCNTDTDSLLSESSLLSPMGDHIPWMTPVVPVREQSEPRNYLQQLTVEPATPSTSSVQPDDVPTPVATPVASSSARKRGRKNEEKTEVIDEAISSISAFLKNKTEDDPDIAFGHYIGLQLKRLPARKKKMAKSNFLNFLLELEEDD